MMDGLGRVNHKTCCLLVVMVKVAFLLSENVTDRQTEQNRTEQTDRQVAVAIPAFLLNMKYIIMKPDCSFYFVFE